MWVWVGPARGLVRWHDFGLTWSGSLRGPCACHGQYILFHVRSGMSPHIWPVGPMLFLFVSKSETNKISKKQHKTQARPAGGTSLARLPVSLSWVVDKIWKFQAWHCTVHHSQAQDRSDPPLPQPRWSSLWTGLAHAQVYSLITCSVSISLLIKFTKG